MAREKLVFKTPMVAHVWAQQKQQSGRNPQGNFYFDGYTIYSYGRHFPIARFVTNNAGQRAVLRTTDRYSSTTARHVSLVGRALPDGLPVFHVKEVRDTSISAHKDQRLTYERDIAEKMGRAARARLHGQWHFKEAVELTEEANAYSKFFKLRRQLPVPVMSAEWKAQCVAAVAAEEIKKAARRKADEKRHKAAEAERAKRDAEQAIEDAKTLADWLAGQPVHLPRRYAFDRGHTQLRVFGDLVQTSQGAEIPVAHAKRIWPVIQRAVNSGKGYVKNGHTEHVGHFEVDEIRPDGTLIAGCHTIAYSEIQKIARDLELVPA